MKLNHTIVAQAHRAEAERNGREHGVKGRAVGAQHVRLALAQLEERGHADEVHHDRAEHGHGHDVGGERLAAELHPLVAEDRGDADHAAGQQRAVRRVEARAQAGEVGSGR
jgi:hypothetical protein